jgi:hypothetical protein
MSYASDTAVPADEDLLSSVHRLADALDGAEQSLTKALGELASDAARRQGKIIASLIDALSITPAERAVNDAEETKSRAFEKLRQIAREWVRQETLRRVSESDQGPHRLAKTALRARRAARFDTIRSTLWAADDAVKALRQAQSACEAAASAELLDAVSSSQMISWISSSSTFSARSAMRSAAESLAHLRDVVPSCAEQLKASDLDDGPDLVLDLVLDLPFDFASWSNLAALHEAVDACRDTATAIAPLGARLRALREDASGLLHQAVLELTEIEAPFAEAARAALLAQLNPGLRETLAPHLEPGP